MKDKKPLDQIDKVLSVYLLAAALFVLLLCAMVSDARASQYTGLTIGQSIADIDCSRASECDQIGFSYGILHGYRIKNWGGEVSYISHGEFSSDFSALHMSGSAESVSISAVGFLPLSDQHELFARIGYGYQQKDLSADVPGRFSVHISPEEGGFDLGAGMKISLNESLSVRFSYDNYIDVDSLNLTVIVGW